VGKRVQVLFAVLFVVMFVPAFGSTATAAPVTVGHSGWTWGNPSGTPPAFGNWNYYPGPMLPVAEFDSYAPTRRTLRQFLGACDDLRALIRGVMLPDPDKA